MKTDLNHVLHVFEFWVIKVKVDFYDKNFVLFFPYDAENLSVFAKILRKLHKILILGMSRFKQMLETLLEH